MKERLLAVAGVASALAASSCCIVPLLLASLGVSGAWIGNLTALAPYQPLFVVAALACLATGFWLVYRPAATRAAACAIPRIGRFVIGALWVKGALWAGAVLVALSVGVDYGARLLL